MNRFLIMTVGKTHSGKTTFAKKLESVLEQAIVIDQDNHAEFINKYYKKIRPNEGPNTLKFTITNAIVKYATEFSDFHLILSNANLHKPARLNILHSFHEKGFKKIIVYFKLPTETLEERIRNTERSKEIFRNASSFTEVLGKQELSKIEEPTKDEADYLFVIKNPEEIAIVIDQIQKIID